ncbi:hypothetical protein [Micromonospora sp. RV43]|uniref:hypothetical protein n=1 Tax=Micromonospora sp. RV43 TaxID=1661387 RepID=UPI00064C036B|nr:hypothetical protein [Micromonospora sp. RV43]
MTTIDQATARKVLDTPMQDNDTDAATIRDYLVELLAAVWSEGEGFSGKRPFGNSGWDFELSEALVRAGLVDGAFDGDGYLARVNGEKARALIAAAIQELRVQPAATAGEAAE